MFKVGDRLIDLHYVKSRPVPRGPGCVVFIIYSESEYGILFDGESEPRSRYSFDGDMIPEEIYNSSLYQALKEDDVNVEE